jgi:hypothetical protein
MFVNTSKIERKTNMIIKEKKKGRNKNLVDDDWLASKPLNLPSLLFLSSSAPLELCRIVCVFLPPHSSGRDAF